MNCWGWYLYQRSAM